MFERIALTTFAAAALAAVATPASAGVVKIGNGDFTGATYPSWVAPPGTLVQPTYSFGAHSYLDTFAWSNTGSGALSYIAKQVSLVGFHQDGQFLFGRDTPGGYHGNIYAADAGPDFDAGTYLVQLLDNLTVGRNYTISFLQSSGSAYQVGGDTAQWQVGFGGSISRPHEDIGDYTAALSGTALNPLTTKKSDLMENGSDGGSPWTRQYLTFKADRTSELLSFFATGSGAPPFALLADVSISTVPEPATWLMMILGFGAIGHTMRRRNRIATRVSYS